jgi:hypothetical protein
MNTTERKTVQKAIQAFEREIDTRTCKASTLRALNGLRELLNTLDDVDQACGKILYSNGEIYTVTIYDNVCKSDTPIVWLYTKP